jgi:hypothetical protein
VAGERRATQRRKLSPCCFLGEQGEAKSKKRRTEHAGNLGCIASLPAPLSSPTSSSSDSALAVVNQGWDGLVSASNDHNDVIATHLHVLACTRQPLLRKCRGGVGWHLCRRFQVPRQIHGSSAACRDSDRPAKGTNTGELFSLRILYKETDSAG